MALTLSYDAYTEIGLVRSTNQDSAYTSPRMLMVADGMGGAAAGDLASAVAVRELARVDAELDERVAVARAERLASDEPQDTDDPDHPGELVDVLTVMAGTLARANERLVELVEDDAELTGMGTTVCGYVLSGDRLAVVNIGDSRAYLVRDGRLHRVTRDHSWVQTLVDDGRITEEEALEHPHRSLVLRVLSGSSEYEPDLGWLDVRAGDRLLVCSDGLCGLVTDASIEQVAAAGLSRPETIEGLVRLAHDAGGYDNITVVLADVEVDGPLGPVEMIGAGASVVEPTAPAPAADASAALADRTPHPDELRERALTEDERYALAGRRRASGVVKLVLALVLPLLLLGGGAAAWYQYTQTRLFIGPQDTRVALFRGVPTTVLGRPLSSVLVEDDTRIADLPPYYAERVRQTIPVASVEGGRLTLDELKAKAQQCIAQRERRAQATAAPSPTPTPTPTPTDLVTPATSTASPGLTETPTATPTPTTTPTPVTAPEDC